MTNFQAETEAGNVVPKKINQTIQQEAKCGQLWQLLQSVTATITRCPQL